MKANKIRSIFLVMDFYEHNLSSILSRDIDNFSENHLEVLVYNLLCAFNYLHSANVLHRDIKPSNIMVESNCTVKICDFGLSRSFEESLSLT